MTIKKKILSFIMIIFITFVSVTGIYFDACAYANSLTDYGGLFSTFVQLVGANDDVPINVLDSLLFDYVCPYDAGFIVRTVDRVNYDLTKKVIANYLNNKYSNQDKTKDNITQSDINEFSRDFNQNITYNDNSTTYNDNSRSMVNLAIDSFKEDNKYYVAYSIDLSLYSKTYWWTADLENIISQYGDEYYIFGGATGGNASKWVYYLVDKNKFAPVWRANIGSGLTARYAVDFYNTKTFDRTAPDGGFYYFERNYNGTIGNMTATTPQAVWSGNKYFQCFVNNYKFISSEYGIPLQNNYIFVTNGSNEPITIYGTFTLLTTNGRGYTPYYYNNEVYSDFSSSTGDYTVNTDNRNYVTYGDVTTYIDDHHTETGSYPSISDINIWIDEQPKPTPNPTPTPNPDNPSGGGGSGSFVNNNNPSITNNPTFNNNPNINVTLFPSVSGNTVSGNGTGSEGGIGSIFGWLGDLGQVIGDLIKNLGEAIKNIVIGISDLITSIVTDLPTMFFDFIGAFFGWMPPEWTSLLSLSLAAMLIFGIIKIFRG